MLFRSLDYEGDPGVMGKNLGDDLAEGKTTLPLIRAMAAGSEEQAEILRSAILGKDVARLPEVVAIIRQTDALDYARAKAEFFRDSALGALDGLHGGAFGTNLRAIAQSAAARSA